MLKRKVIANRLSLHEMVVLQKATKPIKAECLINLIEINGRKEINVELVESLIGELPNWEALMDNKEMGRRYDDWDKDTDALIESNRTLCLKP